MSLTTEQKIKLNTDLTSDDKRACSSAWKLLMEHFKFGQIRVDQFASNNESIFQGNVKNYEIQEQLPLNKVAKPGQTGYYYLLIKFELFASYQDDGSWEFCSWDKHSLLLEITGWKISPIDYEDGKIELIRDAYMGEVMHFYFLPKDNPQIISWEKLKQSQET